MLKRNTVYHLAAAFAVGAFLAFTARAYAAEPTAKDMDAMAESLEKSLGGMMTPEKQKAMEAAMQKHMGGMGPEMEAMGKSMEKSINSPEMRESMDKVSKEMSGMIAKQVPAMMQAVQPMLNDVLPRMLRMQADMLQILFAAPEAQPKK
jgi:hypothetical protein